ncbi:MAG: TRAP transporter substrate-binding protein DctP [Thermoanaerobaculales bacterium]|nr:TRAP transporter substrate-binding protein DctP [Thermoanaerobaculales bacterium]
MRRSLTFSFLLALCWTQSVGATQLKIATLAPDGSFWMNEVRRGADEIAEKTSGRIKMRLYPGGTMGNDQAILRKMRIGQLQGGMVMGMALTSITPDLQVYGLPLVFRSYAEVDFVRERMDSSLISSLEDKGYISFGLIEGGFAYIMSNKPTRAFADLKGQKAWIPEGDIVGEAILDAAGFSSVPLPISDVLTGLQTGLIDTVAGPPVAAVALQWFTRTKYFTDMPILYSCGSLLISKKAFSKLDPADQNIVREVMGRVSKTLDERTRTDNERAREALTKQGIEFIEVQSAALAHWSEVAKKATDSLNRRGGFPAARMDEINAHLRAFRKQDE